MARFAEGEGNSRIERQEELEHVALERVSAAPGVQREFDITTPDNIETLAIHSFEDCELVPAEVRAVLVEPDRLQRVVNHSSNLRIERWRALGALEVRLHPQCNPGQIERDRQIHFLSHVMAHPPELEWALQLQLVARPVPDRPGRSSLAMRLVCAASGATEAIAVRHLRDFAASVALGGHLLGPTFEFVPVTEPSSLSEILLPFAPLDLVEIRRPVERFRDSDRFTDSGMVFGLPAGLPARTCTGQWLCQALVAEAQRHGQPLSWTVTVEASPDVGIARRMLQNSLASSEAAYRRHRALSAGVTSAEMLEAHRAVTAWSLAAQQRSALAGLSGRVQAFLSAGDGPVPASVIAAAISDSSDNGSTADQGAITPPVAVRIVQPEYWHHACRGLRSARCASADEDAGELTHLYDLHQTAALFWLPIPGRDGLPGLTVPPGSREVWLPQYPSNESAPSPGLGLVLGDNVANHRRQPVSLSSEDRRRHSYVIGQTGVGKSTALLNYVKQDMDAGRGLAVFDPHGDLIADILRLVPESRLDDVVLIDPSDRQMPVGFNMLQCDGEDERHLVAEGVIGIMYKLFDPNYVGIVGPRFEHAVRNAILTATSGPNMTLVDVVRLLTDPSFVRKLLPLVDDPLVRRYWTDQIANTSDFHKSEILDYIVSKFSPFVHNPLVRNIIGQGQSTFSLREVMDNSKILLVNLAQGALGSKLATFLGMVLMPKLLTAALSRGDVPEAERRDFSLYVDEFQNYASPVFVEMLSGARKYRLNITMAHQHVGQLPREVRQAVFGNVGTLIAMRVGVEDANVLAEAMQPSTFQATDFLELPNYHAIAQVLADGRKSRCFSLVTLPPPPPRDAEWSETVRQHARNRYGRPRAQVEAEIAERAEL
ncbi:MAG: type IV secretory system conjugative DNA transfer family protein [Chloroflexota bacterium]